jgi:hypothetical protein
MLGEMAKTPTLRLLGLGRPIRPGMGTRTTDARVLAETSTSPIPTAAGCKILLHGACFICAAMARGDSEAAAGAIWLVAGLCGEAAVKKVPALHAAVSVPIAEPIAKSSSVVKLRKIPPRGFSFGRGYRKTRPSAAAAV